MDVYYSGAPDGKLGVLTSISVTAVALLPVFLLLGNSGHETTSHQLGVASLESDTWEGTSSLGDIETYCNRHSPQDCCAGYVPVGAPVTSRMNCSKGEHLPLSPANLSAGRYICPVCTNSTPYVCALEDVWEVRWVCVS